MATWIAVDGTKTEVSPANGKSFTLKEAQEFVGGYVEMHKIPSDGDVILMDEDGRMKGLPINIAASNLMHGQIVGPVLVCKPSEFK